MFQFLIGTLQTKEAKMDLQKLSEFQFLIGTLQTMLQSCRREQRSAVSIPYRYATNPEGRYSQPVARFVSIPYRYATNGDIAAGVGDQLAFQFLIGTLQTWLPLAPSPSTNLGFNSL